MEERRVVCPFRRVQEVKANDHISDEALSPHRDGTLRALYLELGS